MKRFTFFIAFALLIFQVNAQVITVKPDGTGDYTVIQEAIEAAVDGDTVLVHEGTYYEHINFLGKKIVVGSLYLTNPQNPFHIMSTVIDGSNPGRADSNSVVHFVSGEDTNSVLHGFTITNGCGTLYKGGGILVHNSGARIVHNRIIDNQVLPSGNGAGIYAGASVFSPQHFVIIEHNTIEKDSLYTNFQHYGAGMSVNLNARIRYNIIQDNHITAVPVAGLGAAIGGGIYCDLYSYEKGDNYYSVIISDNTIRNNTLNSSYTRGGGVRVNGGKVIFNNNIIENNKADSDTTIESSAGGGAIIGWYREGTEIIGNIFEDNVSEHDYNFSYGGGLNVYTSSDSTWSNIPIKIEKNQFINNEAGYGGGMRLSRCNMLFQNNYIYGNTGWVRGSAMILANNLKDPDSVMKVLNNTIIGNNPFTQEVIRCNTTSKILFMNNIMYDTATLVQLRYTGLPANLQIHYNLIDESKILGQYTGSNNIFDDPNLIEGSYLFENVSTPCLDRGIVKLDVFNLDIECPPDDIDGNPRPQSGTSEIGAYEILFFGIPESTEEEIQVSVTPNPIQHQARISYISEAEERAFLSLYDITGNKVIEREFSCHSKSKCELLLHVGELSPGIYLVRIVSGDKTGTARLIVARN